MSPSVSIRVSSGFIKVYGLQETTQTIVETLQQLSPKPLNAWFLEIVKAGSDQSFHPDHNQDWLRQTSPILTAFFHAKFMLEMAVRYGSLKEAPKCLPSGWAALLYLYNLR